MGKIVSAIVGLLLILLAPSAVLASHGKVLGTETAVPNVEIPVNQGPGFLLPNSPFYFLDLWRDSLLLFLNSTDADAKAKLHLKIAGERITEVKLILEARDVNAQGLDIALANIVQNIDGAALTLKNLKNKGQNVEDLALELDQIIDTQQGALRIIARAHDDKFRLKIKAVEDEIDEDEVEIEDELPDDELEKEIEDELEEEIEDEIENASESGERVEELRKELKKFPTPTPTPGKGGSTSESGSSGSSGSGSDDDDANNGSSGSSGSRSSGSGSSGSSGSSSGDND